MARLAFWQVMQHGRLAMQAGEEHTALSILTPSRGQILTSDGLSLATDVTMSQVYALPKDVKNPIRTAEELAPVLGLSAHDLQSIESHFASYSGYVLLASKVDAPTAQAVARLSLPGIVLSPTIERDYPEGQTASQLIGFVGSDGHGEYGLERRYDSILSGTYGFRSALKDTAGNNIRVGPAADQSPQGGAQLQLSINSTVQGYVEDELQRAVKRHSADGGTIIVMDPSTGYVLGMASTPSYDPNHFGRYPYASYMNPAIESTYEPGSTFKIITMAAGLDTGVITPTTAFDDTGSFSIAGQILHNWNNGGFGWETMTQVLQHSANVGAAWVSQRLGQQAFYTYVNRFGIGRRTGIDLPGEVPGYLPLPGQKSWTVVNRFTNAYGQGLSVTPLQILRAVAAVANRGVMMKPQIVQSIREGGRTVVNRPASQGRVISVRSAHTLTDMLVHSAIDGEASLGLVKGYNVAAKTGTANVAGPDGHYLANDTIASIVGYAPAFNPRFIVLVKIDHPRDTPWGSTAAAPVLRDLLQDLFMHYHIPPNPQALNR